MFWWLALVVTLLVLYGVYRARCAWAPFTSNGRRRLLYWRRAWWSGAQSENRDEY